VSVKFLLPFALAPLLAHDLYLRPETFRPAPAGTLRVEYHNGDGFPGSQATTKIERLRDTALETAKFAAPFENLRIEGATTWAPVRLPGTPGTFLLKSRTAANFIELTATEFEEYLREEGLTEILAWRKEHGETQRPGRELYAKYAKALGFAGAPDHGFQRLAGHEIEFVPLADPLSAQPGQALTFRLLFRGAPRSGVLVELAHAASGKVTKSYIGRTGPQGEIRVPVTGAGLWKLHAIVMERGKTPQADWESHWASFVFELP
jgi:hypothetical protein